MSTDSSPFSLVASDLDGTLFDNEGNISAYTKRVIFRLCHEKNVKFVMATGRHFASVVPSRKSLQEYFERAYTELESSKGGKPIPEKQHGFYVISSNGALVHDQDGKVFVEHRIKPDIAKKVYRLFGLPYTCLKRGVQLTDEEKARRLPSCSTEQSRNGGDVANGVCMDEGGLNEDPNEISFERVRISAYTGNEWFLTSRFLPEELMIKKFGFIPNIIEFDPEDSHNEGKSVLDFLPIEGVNKICLRSKDRALLNSFERELFEMFGDQVSIAFSSNYCLDVGPGGVSKFSALREIADHLSIDVKRIVTFGDSMNDKEMLENAGRGYIMDNAQARLKKQLPQCTVIGHNNDDAVAKKIEELFNLL